MRGGGGAAEGGQPPVFLSSLVVAGRRRPHGHPSSFRCGVRSCELDGGGGGGRNGSLGSSACPPPHPLQKFFSQENEIYQKSPTLEVHFGYTNCFSGL